MSNAVSYGAVGTILVVQSWLVGVGYTVYGGALVGRLGQARHHPAPATPREFPRQSRNRRAVAHERSAPPPVVVVSATR